MSSDRDRLRQALDSMIFLPHLRDRQAQSAAAALLPGGAAPGGQGRPWDRGDLFRRLHTFRSASWFAKPACIGAVECARRGWTNVDLDLLRCESCKAALSCPIPPELLPDEAQEAADRYAKKLTDAHDAGCPWHTAACSLSLLQFPELPRGAVLVDFQDRARALQHLLCLPPMAGEALEALQAHGQGVHLEQLLRQGAQPEREGDQDAPAAKKQKQAAAAVTDLKAALCEGTATCEGGAFKARVRMLALCGWDLRVVSTAPAAAAGSAASTGSLPAHVGPESAVLACTLCGVKAGLWASFPQCQAQVHVAPLQSVRLRSALGPGTGGQPSPGVARALSRNVAVDLATTIAGGAMLGTSPPAGPFGTGQDSSRALFGPPGGSPAAAAAAATPLAPVAGAGPGANPPSDRASLPAFGFAAIRAANGGDPGASAAAGSKRGRDPFWDALSGADAAAGSSQQAAQGTAPSAGTGARALSVPRPAAAAAAVQQPTAAVLQRHRAMASQAVDPLSLHRPFCPWAHSPRVGGDEGGECGWRWCLRQLTPGEEGAPGSQAGGGGAGGEEGRDVAAGWDPAALLRSALAKVQVKK